MNAREAIEQFFDLLCKKDVEVDEFEELIQLSYREAQNYASNKIDRSVVWNSKKKELVASKDRSKIVHLQGWQNAIENLLNKKPKSYRILSEKLLGVNMINFLVEISTMFMKLIYSSPNIIRESGTWYINPISALPRKTKKK